MTRMTGALRSHRLELVPMTLGMVEAVMMGRREDAEALAKARMPARWPNRELVERAFAMPLEAIQSNPAARLWGARVLIAGLGPDEDRRVIGSVVFRGQPCPDGICEIAYGVEDGSQGLGYATEAVAASVRWALGEETVQRVQATTFAWHRPSVRVLEKVGMVCAGVRDHEVMGEMLVYERRKDAERLRDQAET